MDEITKKKDIMSIDDMPEAWELEYISRGIKCKMGTCHVHKYPWPDGVGACWGGYDRFSEWQSQGRHLTLELVEQNQFANSAELTDFTEDLIFVDSNGRETDNFNSTTEEVEELGANRGVPPVSLLQVLQSEESVRVGSCGDRGRS
ncbi:hypothetical protein BX600DRAFT_550578 [Xylariales sp. PMI_506]|nr:hypothetical protein BX600DRAFT_550578 [Xylariales sp. PMI_506]